MKKFLKSERGDSNFVSIIVIIVIILAVAVIFREGITNAVSSVMEKLTNFINQN